MTDRTVQVELQVAKVAQRLADEYAGRLPDDVVRDRSVRQRIRHAG